MNTELTRMIYADELQPGMVILFTCQGPYCPEVGAHPGAGEQHELIVLRIRSTDSAVVAIVIDTDGEQLAWASRAVGAVRIQLPAAATAPEPAPAQET